MTWENALDIVVARTKHGPYRDKCEASHPEHEFWRKRMIEKATGEAPRPMAPSYPPLAEQVGNALKAGLAFAISGFKLTSQEEHDRRISICHAPCEFWDKSLGRCVKCGCVDTIKAWIESQKCPMNYWEERP